MATFDPLKYGAVPVQSNQSFDPFAYGAKPVDPIEAEKIARRAKGLPVSKKSTRAEPTIGGNIVRGLVRGPVRAALNIENLPARAASLVTGKKVIPQEINNDFLGRVTEIGGTINEKAKQEAKAVKEGRQSLPVAISKMVGQAGIDTFDVASFAPTLGLAGQAGKLGAKIGGPVVGALATAVTRGGLTSGAYEASAELADEGKLNPAKIGKAILIGTGLDIGIGKGLPALSKLPKKIVETTKGKLQQSALNSIDKQTTRLLADKGLKVPLRNAKAKGTDVSTYLRKPEVFSGLKVVDNKIDTTKSVNYVDDIIDKLITAKQRALPEIERVTPKVDKSEIRRRAVESITNGNAIRTADEIADLADIDKQLAVLPEKLSVTELDNLRARFRKSARDARGIQKKSSEYTALENAFRDTVFDTTDNLPYDIDGNFKNVSNEIKNLINTKEFLEKSLSGKTVRGGRLQKYIGRIIGAAGGSSAGIGGAIAGSEIGGAISDIITNNQLGSSFKMQLIEGMTDDPAILKQAQELLKNAQDFQVPRLPAPPASKQGIQTNISNVEPIVPPLKNRVPTYDKQTQRIPNMSRQNTAKSTIAIQPNIAIPKQIPPKKNNVKKLSPLPKKK